MESEVVGAIKIKDGIFIGDEFAAQDLEFVVANKVTRVINCAGRQVPNHWEPIGVQYLTYFWFDQDSQVILDAKDQIATECFNFIEEALNKGDSILVHSVKGQSRACTIVASWIMRKYQWSLLKTLEFLNSRRPDLEIRANFIHQLTSYENHLSGQGIGPKTSKWTEVSDKTNEFENEELLLRNTYLNAQMGPFADFTVLPDKTRPAKIKWTDTESKEKATLATVIPSETEAMPSVISTRDGEQLTSIIKMEHGATRNGRNAGSASSSSLKDEKKTAPKFQPAKEKTDKLTQHSARDASQLEKEKAPLKGLIKQPSVASSTKAMDKGRDEPSGKKIDHPMIKKDPIQSQNFVFGEATKNAELFHAKPDIKAIASKVIMQAERPITAPPKPGAEPGGVKTITTLKGKIDRVVDAKMADKRLPLKQEAKLPLPSQIGKIPTEEAKAISRPLPPAHLQNEGDTGVDTTPVTRFNNFLGQENEEVKFSDQRRPLPSAQGEDDAATNNLTESLSKMYGLNAAVNEKLHSRDSEKITHIINQNNINNYIIQNAQKVEVIEYKQAPSSGIPIQKQCVIHNEGGNISGTGEPIVKKVIPQKKGSATRSSSAAVRRDQNNPRPGTATTENRETLKENTQLREKKIAATANYKYGVNPANLTSYEITKSTKGGLFDKSNPHRMGGDQMSGVASSALANQALGSFRKGPVKAGISTGMKTIKQQVDPALQVPQPRNPTPISREGGNPPKPEPPIKKTKPTTGQHCRPSSPGIHGKVAQQPYASYTKTIKTYSVPVTKTGKSQIRSTSPRQASSSSVALNSAIVKSDYNPSQKRGLSPSKPKWKA